MSRFAGVRLVPPSNFRLTDQLYADDFVVLGESEADLQLALDAVTRWGRQWRFSFGVGPEKSAVMIFGPGRSRPSCRVCLSGQPLPVVSSCRYLGVVLTFSLRWDAHSLTLFLVATASSRSASRGSVLKALSVSFAHFLLATHVFPSTMCGTEFVGDCARSLAQLDLAQRRWGRHLLSWPAGTPCAAVLQFLLFSTCCPHDGCQRFVHVLQTLMELNPEV